MHRRFRLTARTAASPSALTGPKGETHLYVCQQCGALALPPDGRLRRVLPSLTGPDLIVGGALPNVPETGHGVPCAFRPSFRRPSRAAWFRAPWRVLRGRRGNLCSSAGSSSRRSTPNRSDRRGPHFPSGHTGACTLRPHDWHRRKTRPRRQMAFARTSQLAVTWYPFRNAHVAVPVAPGRTDTRSSFSSAVYQSSARTMAQHSVTRTRRGPQRPPRQAVASRLGMKWGRLPERTSLFLSPLLPLAAHVLPHWRFLRIKRNNSGPAPVVLSSISFNS